MGQKVEFDEATSEALANRVPLPPELANELVFGQFRICFRWKGTDAEDVEIVDYH